MNMRRSAGFSMMEIMAVLFIIGLILSMVGPRIVKMIGKGNTTATESLLGTVKSAVLEYQMDVGGNPKTLEHLVKNVDNNPKWKGPYIEGMTDIPLDKWDRPLMYNNPPKVFTKEYKYFEILSYGEKLEAAEPEEYLHKGS